MLDKTEHLCDILKELRVFLGGGPYYEEKAIAGGHS